MHGSVYYSRELVLKLHEEGMSITDIAHKTNLSVYEVTTILTEAKEIANRENDQSVTINLN